ncbi:MAG: hypothetical protein PHS62_02035 [Patescibacteria group bacterium]|nr:hypothetical protein [Patescibacteria group bacterium]
MDKKFPILKIISTASVVLHEYTDPERIKRLRNRFLKGKFMRNPVLATKLKSGKYLILDGANRVTVFDQLKIKHIVAQIVDYKEPFVSLKTWNHLICDQIFKKYYTQQVKKFKTNEIEAISNFVNLYKGRFKFYRVLENNFDIVKRQYKNAVCLTVFPKFQMMDIVKFVLNGKMVPSGITRHLINGRALRLNVPLQLLKNRQSLAKKNYWLARQISKKVKANQVRYYAESVFLFDE